MRRQLLQGSAMRRQLLQLCLPWPRLPRHGCFLSVSWASNQPRECRGEPRDEISVQSANYLPDIRLLSTANPFKSLLLLQKCVLKGLRKAILERARALKKRLFWKSLTRYGSRGVATGVPDAPPAAFSTHGLSLAFAVWRWPALLLLPPGAALGAPGGQGWVGPGLPGAARAPCPSPPPPS